MTPDTTPRSKDEAALLELAGQRLPGGVLGTARQRDELAFVVKRAQGSHLWDWSGREYIDYLLGSGPMFLGHGHPAVTRAVTEQLRDGTTFFMVTEGMCRAYTLPVSRSLIPNTGGLSHRVRFRRLSYLPPT